MMSALLNTDIKVIGDVIDCTVLLTVRDMDLGTGSGASSSFLESLWKYSNENSNVLI